MGTNSFIQHYGVSIVILIVILIFQLRSFIKTWKKTDKFGGIFPNGISKGVIVNQSNAPITKIIAQSRFLNSSIFAIIVSAINSYLERNKSNVSDYHLIKDIVDRNCDVVEDEIRSQQSTPIYYGLMGTMIGILVGVGMLYFSKDGLQALFTIDTDSKATGVGGVQDLLGGVALAMLTSIFGIIMSIITSVRFNRAKELEEAGKHEFLSWIQAELLPELATDAAAVMNKLANNLHRFNDQFSQNSDKLNNILSKVIETYQTQTKLLNAIQGMDIERLATVNITVYQELKNCTDEIGQFGMYLKNVNGYIANVTALSAKLDDARERTRLIENMGEFFMKERASLERMDAVINKTVSDVHESLKDSVNNLKSSSQSQIGLLVDSATKQRELYEQSIAENHKALENHSHEMLKAYEECAEKENQALQRKTTELSAVTSELKQMTAVKESMDKQSASIKAMQDYMRTQTDAISKLAQEIKKLAEKKSDAQEITATQMPRWIKPVAFAVGGVVVFSCLFVVTHKVLSMFGINLHF